MSIVMTFGLPIIIHTPSILGHTVERMPARLPMTSCQQPSGACPLCKGITTNHVAESGLPRQSVRGNSMCWAWSHLDLPLTHVKRTPLTQRGRVLQVQYLDCTRLLYGVQSVQQSDVLRCSVCVILVRCSPSFLPALTHSAMRISTP